MIDGKTPNALSLHRILFGVSLYKELPVLGDDDVPGSAVGYYRSYLVFALDTEAAEELAHGDVQDGIVQRTESEMTSLEDTDAELRPQLAALESPGIAWRSGRTYYQERSRGGAARDDDAVVPALVQALTYTTFRRSRS